MSPKFDKTNMSAGVAPEAHLSQPGLSLSIPHVLFWLLAPLAFASAVSVLLDALLTGNPITTLALRLNNSFGVGVQAVVDVVRVWTGRDWLLDNSWTPMLRALHHLNAEPSAPLYERLFFSEHTKFQYPPTSLLPLELLGTALQLTPASLNAINSVVLVANAGLIALLASVLLARSSNPQTHLLPTAGNVDGLAIPLIAFCAFWLFYPVTRAFNLGQIQIWIDLAFTASCLLWCLGRKAAAGLCIGLVSSIKPQLGLLILWALAWREWKFASGLISAVLPIALVSVWRYGWNNHVDYLNVLSYISQHGEVFYRNNSVNGLINRLLYDGTALTWDANNFAPYNYCVHAATLLASAVFILLPLSIPFIQRDRRANFFDFGAAALCFTLASPVAWEHHYGIMLPLLIGLLGFAHQKAPTESRHFLFAALTASWVLSAGHYEALKLLSSPFNILQSHLFFGAILLLILLLRASSLDSRADIPLNGRRGFTSPDRVPNAPKLLAQCALHSP